MKVIKVGNEPVKHKTTCENCSSVLEWDINDMKCDRITTIGIRIGRPFNYVVCPICNKKVYVIL